MTIEFAVLPYMPNELAPHISEETLEYHYGKHYFGYVKKINQLIASTPMAEKSLGDILKIASGDLFETAAQVWNHEFYWNCLLPEGGDEPTGIMGGEIDKAFGSFSQFQSDFNASAIANFGSGWTWLVKSRGNNTLAIVNTSNANTPASSPDTVPILAVDLWEHAYYLDYRNARPRYLDAFWKLVNWDFAEQNYRA